MSLPKQLKEWERKQKNIKQQEKKEYLSARDLRELMGVDRQKLVRGKGGAFRKR